MSGRVVDDAEAADLFGKWAAKEGLLAQCGTREQLDHLTNNGVLAP